MVPWVSFTFSAKNDKIAVTYSTGLLVLPRRCDDKRPDIWITNGTKYTKITKERPSLSSFSWVSWSKASLRFKEALVGLNRTRRLEP